MRSLPWMLFLPVAVACGATASEPPTHPADSTDAAPSRGDAGADADGRFPCGSGSCAAAEICFQACVLCQAALLCSPADDAGVCPPGTAENAECAASGSGSGGCRDICTPPPPSCEPAVSDSCTPETPSDPRYCSEECA